MIPLVVQHANNLQKQLKHKSDSWSALNHKAKNQRDELDRKQRQNTELKDKLARLKAENELYIRQLTTQAMQAAGYTVAGPESFQKEAPSDKIYLINEFFIDSMENDRSNAIYSKVVGYTDSLDQAIEITSSGGAYAGTGWPIAIGDTHPRFTMSTINRYGGSDGRV